MGEHLTMFALIALFTDVCPGVLHDHLSDLASVIDCHVTFYGHRLDCVFCIVHGVKQSDDFSDHVSCFDCGVAFPCNFLVVSVLRLRGMGAILGRLKRQLAEQTGAASSVDLNPEQGKQ